MNNNNSTSKKINFLELLSNDSSVCNHCANLEWKPISKIEIPIIQRDYAQGREGKEELRKDFLSALLNTVTDKDKTLKLDFIYGSVKDDIFQPLDGQQRLTTLFLLHWFVAIKENKLNDKLKKLLTKFTYETRTSSKEFCNDLINKGINFDNLLKTDYYDKEEKEPKNNELSKTIIDSSWFFLSWKRDPTIKAMLTMLDDIHNKFQNKIKVWDGLKNINFYYIELENFGLSDDLYIKMNARGKPLTDFENFKAKFEQLIKSEGWEADDVELTEAFSHKIDTGWADLFWNYRDDTNIFDEQLLNFFRTMAVINYTLKADKNNEDFGTNINLLRGNDTISFNQYLEFGCFDENYFKTLKAVLNKISDEKGLKEFLPENPYIDEYKIFKGAIKLLEKKDNQEEVKNNLSYADLVIAFAYFQYLALEENIETEKLESWLRVVRNLVEGSRPYLFNNANEFANALHSINELLPNRNSIVKHFAETQNNLLSGFISEQVSEEKLKAKLITESDAWKNAIIEIENHGYFKGQIGFLLDWCKDEDGDYNIDKFKEYTEKAKAIFVEKGLNDSNNFKDSLFERALLATGDYLLKKGSNFSFLINNDRDISWKRLLRDNNDKRKILKQLIDSISVLNLTDDLNKIVDKFSEKNDWRYYFIEQPEMISACGKQKLIRWNSKFDILLLGRTQTNGEHREYYSYSLFVELKDLLSLDKKSYKDQKSVRSWKYFELNEQQVAFNCSSQKYVLLEKQDEDWKIKQELGDREKATLELKRTN